MDPTLANLGALLRETFSDPRGGMRRVLDLGLPMAARWQALALVAVVSALLSQLSVMLTPMAPGTEPLPGFGGGAFRVLILQLVLLVLFVAGLDRIGRAMGGRGTFPDAVLVIAWLQVIMVALQVAQVVALLLVPPMAMLVGLVSVGVFFWMLTGFACELHGFDNRGRVFGVILLSFFALAFVLAFALSIFGFQP